MVITWIAIEMVDGPVHGPGESQVVKDRPWEKGTPDLVTVTKTKPYLHIDSGPVTLDQLQAALSEQVARKPWVVVEIRPDRDAPVGEVLKVINAAKAAHVQMTPSLRVLPEGK